MRQPHEWRSRVTYGRGTVSQTGQIIRKMNGRRVLVVCGSTSFHSSGAKQMVEGIEEFSDALIWDEFEANTSFNDLTCGLNIVREFQPNVIVGSGGGSAMDMAKLLAAYGGESGDVADRIHSGDPITEVDHHLVLIPTTSGSGSEATHFAVVYIGDTKFSVAGQGLYADEIILDPELMMSGSPYQRATSGIDAVCQAIESGWAVASNETSRRYARHALRFLLPSLRAFVAKGDPISASAMTIGAHLSGRAIDISKTTGAHALSYFVTKRFDIPHGNAVALTLGSFIDAHAHADESGRNSPELSSAMINLARAFKVDRPQSVGRAFQDLVGDIGLQQLLNDDAVSISDVTEDWLDSVNIERLSNNPVQFDRDAMRQLVMKSWSA